MHDSVWYDILHNLLKVLVYTGDCAPAVQAAVQHMTVSLPKCWHNMHTVSQKFMVTYHVITCIGTGTHRTTGVRASKLGFASIRSSPALKGIKSQHNSASVDSSCSAHLLNPGVRVYGCALVGFGFASSS